MIQFSKLRLYGFKSFVDKTELEIAPGLNGVVGPNGCGKSNLVEALRWVMGENSARRMRGGTSMDDVIFAGSSKRSARNIAEVSLLLDNSDRTAPAAYNNTDEIEVVRRIERDRGSSYKINGKNVRARDVQMLFADNAAGANSPAIVSQGRVAQIMNAKPLERRIILEESAGISGLYARRHEAELRLRAADKNLIRIEDILGGQETQLNNLKRQARQATRYRNMSAQIRQLEILVALLEWQALEDRTTKSKAAFSEAESKVAQTMTTVTQLTKTQTVQVEDLPALRKKEAEQAAELQTQKIILQRLDEETKRHLALIEETKAQINQAKTDAAHETQTLQESTALQEKLEEEHQSLTNQEESNSSTLEEKEKAQAELEEQVIKLEEKYARLMQGEAEAKARKQSLEQQISQNKERIETLTARIGRAKDELKTLQEENKDKAVIEELTTKTDGLNQKTEELVSSIEAANLKKQETNEAIGKARQAVKDAENKKAEILTEISMLESFLMGNENETFVPVLDKVSSDAGFEKAISRALGDALLASLDDDAPTKWIKRQNINNLPQLPKGAAKLKDHVRAPAELELALSQIGLVEDESQGNNLIDKLQPGQSLVSKTGTYWRWDGYWVKAEASDRNAQFLEHKNKRKELETKRPQVEGAAKRAAQNLESLIETQQDLEGTIKSLQEQMRENERTLNQTRSEIFALREKQARFDSETARLKEIISTAEEDKETLSEVIKWDTSRLEGYEKEAQENNTDSLEEAKETLDQARTKHHEAVRAYDNHLQEQNSRKARLHAIADERINIQNRTIRAREHLKQLTTRKESLEEKLQQLEAQPIGSEDQKQELLDKIAQLEKTRNEAANKLAEREEEVAETGRALKQAENSLSEAREERGHAQATLSGINEQQESLRESILGQFSMEPHALKNHASIDLDEQKENLSTLKDKKESLIRQRDTLGPVNLRADDEAQELEKKVTELLNERNDLMQAIGELRNAISKINKEARERLLMAFEHVNAHFKRLFAELFAGGQAHLSLIDSDDPLDAGLEIFAQPPGKTLQSLSLLSGGEQALTSIALIFAMFLTNPSPICVLDEIDAPLDDANVDRACNLIESIVSRSKTRFLIITHHRMTMARMHRLYGVTMAEKGVSQLVSVDLQQSFDFLEEAA